MSIPTINGKLHAGLARPLRLFHLTDMHLTTFDPADDDYAKQQQAERRLVFPRPDGGLSEGDFGELMRLSESADCVVMTGDIIDAPSLGNLRWLQEGLAGRENVLFMPGNHDWVFPKDSGHDPAVAAQYRPMLERAVGQPLDLNIREVGGLLLVAFDNGYYQVTEAQATAILAALGRGLPTVLCCHIPLYCETLLQPTINYWGGPAMMGIPDEVFERLGKKSDRIAPNAVTAAFVDALRGFDNLVGIITGHLHFNHDDWFTPRVPQFLTQAAVHPPIAVREGGEVPHEPGQARWIEVD